MEEVGTSLILCSLVPSIMASLQNTKEGHSTRPSCAQRLSLRAWWSVVLAHPWTPKDKQVTLMGSKSAPQVLVTKWGGMRLVWPGTCQHSDAWQTFIQPTVCY